MGTPDDEQTRNEREVEITDLDPPGTSHKMVGIRIIEGQRLSFQARWFLLLLTLMGGVAFLFLWFPKTPQEVKGTRPVGTSVVAHPRFVPRSLSLLDGVIYITAADGNVHALRNGDGSLLWRHTGLVDASPVASINGIVFLSEPQSGMVDALRISDGTLLWQRRGLGWPDIENGLVFVSEETTIKALRVSDGAVVWQRKVARQGIWVANGVVYALPDFGGVGAFRATDGSPLWYHKIDGLLIGVDNHMIYLDLWDHSAAALRTSDGSLVWSQKAVQADALSSIRNGMLYFLTLGGELDALRASDGSLLWHKRLPAGNVAGAYVNTYDQIVALCFENGARDFLRASDGSLLWHAPSSASGSAYGLGTDNGLIYLSAPDGGVDARRVTDGMLLWHRRVNGNIMLIEKGIIYFTTDDGSINAMRGSYGTLLWHRVLSISGLTINKTAKHDQAMHMFIKSRQETPHANAATPRSSAAMDLCQAPSSVSRLTISSMRGRCSPSKSSGVPHFRPGQGIVASAINTHHAFKGGQQFLPIYGLALLHAGATEQTQIDGLDIYDMQFHLVFLSSFHDMRMYW